MLLCIPTQVLLMQVVQGYKFNIFYPELIDKLEAPTYSLEKDPAADEHGGTCMLRYSPKLGPICTHMPVPGVCLQI